MRWAWRACVLAAAWSVAGCPLPDATSREFACTPGEADGCAQGWQCVDGTCRATCGMGCPTGTACDAASELCLPVAGASSTSSSGSLLSSSTANASSSNATSGTSGGATSSPASSSVGGTSGSVSSSRASSGSGVGSTSRPGSSSVMVVSSSSLLASSSAVPSSSSVLGSSSSVMPSSSFGGPGPPVALVLLAPQGTWRAGDCLGPFVVETQDAQGVASPVAVTLRFTPSTDAVDGARLTLAVDNLCTVAPSDPRINAGESRALFYLRYQKATPSLTITVTPESTYPPASVNGAVVARAPHHLELLPTTVAGDVGQCTPVVLQVTDEFSNVTGPAAASTVSFSGQGTVATLHLTGACTGAVNSVNLAAGQGPLNIYTRTDQPGTISITATAAQLQQATLQVTTNTATVNVVAPVTVETTRCAGPYRASVVNASGTPVGYAGTLTVTTPNGGAVFGDPCCRAPQTSFNVTAGAPRDFYIGMTQAVTTAVTVSTAIASITPQNVDIVATAAAEPWASAEYCRRAPITVVAQNPVGADYAVMFTVDHAALVQALQAQAGGNDVRVFTTGGQELHRVLADGSAFGTANTTLWVRFPAALGNGGVGKLYLYHDNIAAAAPPANPALVFTRVDDFEDGNLNGWDNVGGAFSPAACPVGGGGCALVNGDTVGPTYPAWLLAQGVSAEGSLVEARWYATGAGFAFTNVLQGLNSSGTVTGYVGGFETFFNTAHLGAFTSGTMYMPDQVRAATPYPTGAFHRVTLWVTAQHNGALFLDGTQMLPTVGFSAPLSGNLGPGQPGFLVAGIAPGVRLYLDDVRVRPFVALEPQTSVGASEKR